MPENLVAIHKTQKRLKAYIVCVLISIPLAKIRLEVIPENLVAVHKAQERLKAYIHCQKSIFWRGTVTSNTCYYYQ